VAAAFGRPVVMPGALLTVAAPVTDPDDPAHPDSGQLVCVLVTLAAGPSSTVEYDQAEFYVRDADGQHQKAWIAGGKRDPLLGSGTLHAGERVRGWLMFDVAPHGTLVLDGPGGSLAEWRF
jgi:hypothetical protein